MMYLLFGMLFSLLWASAFIAGKYTLQTLEPLDMLSLRFLLAAALVFALCVWLTHKGADLGWRGKSLWLHGFLLGLTNYALYLGWSYTGLKTISPELVVLLVSTMPFVTAFVSSLITRQWSWLQWAAILLGFAGVYAVLSARMPQAGWDIGIVWTLMGMLALAAGTLIYRAVAGKHHLLALTGVQNLFGGLLLLPFASPSGWAAAMHNSVFAWSLWYQVIVVSVVAMLMWFQLVRWLGPAHAAAFHLLNPIFATLLARLFFHIPLGWADIAGTLLVVIALGMLNRQNIKQVEAAKRT
ncbi:DMT family transporter [Neisseria sp. 74A18]|uniref:DMT family transporter n=1 Tax=Neisseria sp. 74A18 TaxID=1696094 RepID=UPI001E2ABC3B|nr:DMT family transporter [Neisseria sp. 74A18]